MARADEPPEVHALASMVVLGFERIGIGAGGAEHVGLFGAAYLIELAPGFWLGPELHGAATGQRGGLFTWGADAQYRLPLQRWALAGGLFAGGGGGANAPVGGGLMLRPHAELMFDFGGFELGLNVSHVWFPSGSIDSTQPGAVLRIHRNFSFTEPGHAGEPAAFTGSGGVGADRLEPIVGTYLARRGAPSHLGYVGTRLAMEVSRLFAVTIEGAAAATGGADGYMEALAGVSLGVPVVRH